MIYDHRTYTCRPGMIRRQVELYEKMGRKTQIKHLGEPVVWATTEVGDINQFVHIWAYKDVTDRATRRAAMQADPDWQAYVKATAELGAIVSQENKILVAAEFKK